MIVFVCSRYSRLSVVALCAVIKNEYGVDARGILVRNGRAYDVHTRRRLRHVTIKPDDMVVKFGSSVPTHDLGVRHALNTHVMEASVKPAARATLYREGIDIPEGYDILNPPPNPRWPVIGRPMTHFGGSDIWLCHSHEEVEAAERDGAWYFTQWYPKTKEYRVHCAHGKILAVYEKTIDNDGFGNFIGEPWSYIPWNEYRKCFCRISLNAVRALGLDFGAVDVMTDPTDKSLPKSVVCEVNTAPGMHDSPYTCDRYARYFIKIYLHQWPHYRHEDFDRLRSLAWKNHQLEVG